MSSFYNNITDTNIEVGKVFEKLGHQTIDQWKEIQTSFHETIEREFPIVRRDISDEITEEETLIPESLSKRIKVTTLLLMLLVAGGKYSKDTYLKVVEFCTMSDLNQRKPMQGFSN